MLDSREEILKTLRATPVVLRACQAEWKLLCGTHNLLKLWRYQAARPLATAATT